MHALKSGLTFLAFAAFFFAGNAQQGSAPRPSSPSGEVLMHDSVQIRIQPMKVEIWSDIMCPFCYIGKRHFEAALAQFADSAAIEVEWKSFQLDPSIPATFDKPVNVYQYLADRKGMSLEQSKAMHDRVVAMAKAAGLDYRFDQAVVANSFSAHRMIQFAKTKGLGDAAEERLFKAYFTEGKNFGDPVVLRELGNDIGLSAEEVNESLTSDLWAYQVQQDIQEASAIGVSGVPFFVFDRKFAVSGAQPTEVFQQALQQAYTEWKKNQPAGLENIGNGAVCTPEGQCD